MYRKTRHERPEKKSDRPTDAQWISRRTCVKLWELVAVVFKVFEAQREDARCFPVFSRHRLNFYLAVNWLHEDLLNEYCS